MNKYLLLTPVLLSALSSISLAELPTATLHIKQHKIIAEVAATDETRARGLMHRFSLKPDHGMLFIFESPQIIAMWMKNTYIPLSVAFIDQEGIIINIENMQPQTLHSHAAKGLALYALEMKQGWFKERKIGPGDKLEGLKQAIKTKQ